MYRLQELVRLYRLGTRCHERARLLGMSPNTERPYREAIAKAGLLDGPLDLLPSLGELRSAVEAHFQELKTPKQQESSIAEYEGKVKDLLEEGAGASAIFDFLRLNLEEFDGSLSAVKRMCRRLTKNRPICINDVVIPVQTAPGSIAQVDFGYVGRFFDPDTGRTRRTWVFVMVLGFSRKLYAQFVFDQKVETWISLHRNAFEFFGGSVETVVPDNLKAAVIRAAFKPIEEVALNRSYREFAKHYGFKIDPTPPYSPKKKGKVERSIRYLKSNFISPRKTLNINELSEQLSEWIDKIANQRTHATTARRPEELFKDQEQNSLRALPEEPYDIAIWHKATVHRDSHILFQNRFYSVPWQWIGKSVWLYATSHSLVVYGDDRRIATHCRQAQERRLTQASHLPPERSELRHRSRSYWEERASLMGNDVRDYICNVFDSDDVLSQLRDVQATVLFLERFPKERSRAACRRAQFFGANRYKSIRNILEKALDMEPLPLENIRSKPLGQVPQFSRPKEHFSSFTQLTFLEEWDPKNEYN